MTAIQFITIAIALTVTGWGFGELGGWWINRLNHRRKVRKWLTAEQAWKFTQRMKVIEDSMNRLRKIPLARQLIGGYADISGDRITISRQYVGPGRVQYTRYRNGMMISSWDEGEVMDFTGGEGIIPNVMIPITKDPSA